MPPLPVNMPRPPVAPQQQVPQPFQQPAQQPVPLGMAPYPSEDAQPGASLTQAEVPSQVQTPQIQMPLTPLPQAQWPQPPLPQVQPANWPQPPLPQVQPAQWPQPPLAQLPPVPWPQAQLPQAPWLQFPLPQPQPSEAPASQTQVAQTQVPQAQQSLPGAQQPPVDPLVQPLLWLQAQAVPPPYHQPGLAHAVPPAFTQMQDQAPPSQGESAAPVMKRTVRSGTYSTKGLAGGYSVRG